MMHVTLVLLSAVAALAAPINERAAAPTAIVNNGTIVGDSLLGIDSFKGIPFALPPTGTLRLKPPQTYDQQYPSGTLQATGDPTACPQFELAVDKSNLPEAALALLLDSPIGQDVTTTGEDCLTLNVQRPAGTTADSNLPVVFWIFGGGT